MARLETKSISVSPEFEQKTISTYERFGWTCAGSQTVDTKDSHLERKGDDLVSVTERSNYVKLLFQRDKDMPHYNELVSCESRYYQMTENMPKMKDRRILIVAGIICFVLFLLLIEDGFPGVIFLVLSAVSIFFYVKNYKSAKATFTAEREKWDREYQALERMIDSLNNR